MHDVWEMLQGVAYKTTQLFLAAISEKKKRVNLTLYSYLYDTFFRNKIATDVMAGDG
jgi:hypothetical protein